MFHEIIHSQNRGLFIEIKLQGYIKIIPEITPNIDRFPTIYSDINFSQCISTTTISSSEIFTLRNCFSSSDCLLHFSCHLFSTSREYLSSLDLLLSLFFSSFSQRLPPSNLSPLQPYFSIPSILRFFSKNVTTYNIFIRGFLFLILSSPSVTSIVFHQQCSISLTLLFPRIFIVFRFIYFIFDFLHYPLPTSAPLLFSHCFYLLRNIILSQLFLLAPNISITDHFPTPSFTYHFCIRITFPIPTKYFSCKIIPRDEFSIFS